LGWTSGRRKSSRSSPRSIKEGHLNVIGMGSQDSRGLKKGVVVNIEDTVHTISRVVQEVELMADCKVSNVYTGIAGSHIKSFNSNGMVAIKDKEVTKAMSSALSKPPRRCRFRRTRKSSIS
jgi:cell division protein FtsA